MYQEQVQWILEMGGQNSNGYFVRKIFKKPSEVDTVRKQFKNTDVYCTPYLYNSDNQSEALKIADFYLDFDKKLETDSDFDLVRADAIKALAYLQAIFQVPVETVKIYFSGSKGIHLVVPKEIMGIEPHVDLNRIFRTIAEEIFNYTINKTLDRQIYDNKRLFRLVNSVNAKSNMYKIPISYTELKWASYAEIKQIAKQPRNVEFAKPSKVSKANLFYNKYVNEWEQKLAKSREKKEIDPSKFRRLDTYPPCVDNLITNDVPEGQRNNTAIALANYFQQQKFTEDEVKEVMFEWGSSKCSPPMAESEIETVIESAYRNKYKFGCSTLRTISICDKSKCPFFK